MVRASGISEEVGPYASDLRKRPPDEKPADNCNWPQCFLIQNGTVYLTNLVNTWCISLDERIGFLVELYKASMSPVMAWSKWNECSVLLVPNSGHFRYQAVLVRYSEKDKAVALGKKAAKYSPKDRGRLHASGLLWPRDDLLKHVCAAVVEAASCARGPRDGMSPGQPCARL
ncbi:hypothetical protein GPECTOR_16g764 [Gonium pectorale]|uniref:Uncharacterized protein n=1 Tax=Gonium pectorale TaxID=33097 RepID=A0A150GL60_GONPE|nr:hypothetical protein GPECTOR_16g764 [Gonium pectorale]|eukprot:KXZ50589.1 hypothetical protein GPECTOR_16g764 [Gonium pectorale]